MEYIIAVLSFLLGVLGLKYFQNKKIIKEKEDIKELKEERKEVENTPIPDKVKDLSLEEAKDYWDKIL